MPIHRLKGGPFRRRLRERTETREFDSFANCQTRSPIVPPEDDACRRLQTQVYRASERFRGPVAQAVEHLTFNQRVLGSSPSRPTSVFNVLPLDPDTQDEL